MEKLVFGKNGQVHFDSVEERDEAVEYIRTLLRMLTIMFMRIIRIRELGVLRTEFISEAKLVSLIALKEL